MAIFDRLLAKLHPGMNKDPIPQQSLKITASSATSIIVRDGILQIAGQKTFDLSTYTIASLSIQINSISGFTSNVVASGSLSALALIDGIYTTNCTITIFTSPVWQALKAIAQQFKTQKSNRAQAHFQATTNMSSGIWLDEQGRKIYDVTRESNEPDALYAIRVFDFSLAHRLNNIAIQKILNDLGYASTVVDAAPLTFDVNVTLPLTPPLGFVYSLANLQDIVNILRPLGVQAIIALIGSLTDSVHTTDSISQTLKQESWTWASFPGSSGWTGFSW